MFSDVLVTFQMLLNHAPGISLFSKLVIVLSFNYLLSILYRLQFIIISMPSALLVCITRSMWFYIKTIINIEKVFLLIPHTLTPHETLHLISLFEMLNTLVLKIISFQFLGGWLWDIVLNISKVTCKFWKCYYSGC